MLTLISTIAEPAGFRVTNVHGEVCGASVRTWHIFSLFCIAGRTLVGGEVKSMTKRLSAAREQAIQRMSDEAEARGANAVVGMNVHVAGIIPSVSVTGTAVEVLELLATL